MSGMPAAAGAASAAETPGDDVHRDARGAQRDRLLAAARGHERVAALEPHDVVVAAAELDQQRVDLGLRQRALPGRQPDAVPLGLGGRERDDLVQRRAVVDDDVGARERVARRAGEQRGSPGPAPTR